MVPVKNTGNTLDPVTGTVKVKGAGGSRNAARSQAVRILPGKSVNVPVGQQARQGLLHGHAAAQRSAAGRRSRPRKKFKVK